MSGARLAVALTIACALHSGSAMAQTPGADPRDAAPFGEPVADRHVYFHAVAEEFEDRIDDDEHELRWEVAAWAGGDWNRVWLKSEGELAEGGDQESTHQLLYARPLTRFFDLQAGLRYDVANGDPSRGWLAVGIDGMAPLWFELEATLYAADEGRVAGRLRGSYDLLLTQRLILQPDIELNFYGQSDRRRSIGTGLSDLDLAVRLRYELSRKFAPYVGLTYFRAYGKTASFLREEDVDTDSLTLLVGVRAWF